MVYTSPRASDEEILSAYKESADRDFIAERRGRDLTYARLLGKIGKLVSGCRGRLLDVGCATGFFLDLARRDGWQVAGIEPSEWASSYARDVLGLDVKQGTVSTAELRDNYFDVITLWDVVEHLVDPLGDFTRLAAALKPGGLLAFSTHSIESPAARILGGRYPFLMAMHVTHFTPRTSGVLCAKAGLRQFEAEPHVRWLRVSYMIGKIGAKSERIAAVIRRGAALAGALDAVVPVVGLGIFNAYAKKA